MVAKTLVPGVAVNEVAWRHGVKANHVSVARQGLAQHDPERGRGDCWRGLPNW